ncbi:MAG: tripartite tricarboxylate transporter permease [Methanomicrobiaceae archaeon]|nr:tripartite tricarboxylate transporter permease [Methanomicrobiaceae archaeon]
MYDIIAGVLIGVILGSISGLIPGIHANTMAGILLSTQGAVLFIVGPAALAVSMFSALVTHTFLDAVPATFLGIPDPDTAISVLPSHRMCLEGRAEEAVRLSAIGGAVGCAISMPIFAVFYFLLPSLQGYIDWWIGIILIIFAGILILQSESPEWSFAVFVVSGILGLLTFRYSWLSWNLLGESSLLMPLLTGLFGISVLLYTKQGEMPFQEYKGIALSGGDIAKSGTAGTIAGATVGWLPGLSNASANAILASVFRIEKEGEGFITATGAANTANAFLALAAFYALSRTRNGVMVALSQGDIPPVTTLILAGTLAAFAAFMITILLSGSASLFSGIDARKLGFAVISFVTILCFAFTGPFGLVILVLATMTGIVPYYVNIRRVPCIGAVMIPVICWSFGLM